MRELLADDRRSDFGTLNESIEESKNSSQRDIEMSVNKCEKESPFGSGQQQESQAIQISPSPVNLSNDSNSGDGHYEGSQRGEFKIY